MSLRRPGPSVTAGAPIPPGGTREGKWESPGSSIIQPVCFLAALKCLSSSSAMSRERRMAADGGKTAKRKKIIKILLRRLLLIGPYQPAPKKTTSLIFIYRILGFYHCRSRKLRYEIAASVSHFSNRAT